MTTTTMHTRKDYLDGKCTHREYYGQYVTPQVKGLVSTFIGVDRIKKSTDPHLNDIPLRDWDRLVPMIENDRNQWKDNGDYYTQAGGVCILKEAARQLIED